VYEALTVCSAQHVPLALSLADSLADTGREFRLRIVCMDGETSNRFAAFASERIVPLDISRIEVADPELASAKQDRNLKEYCSTAKSAALLYAFENEPALDRLTYLDSDLMFWVDPEVLWAECEQASVVLHEHRHARRWRRRDRWAPPYNGGFMSFRADGQGVAALRLWRERCLGWRRSRPRSRFSDQPHMADLPQRFAGAHVLEHPGAGLSPWNSAAHQLEGDETAPLVDGRPLVFYHFQSLRLRRDTTAGRRLSGRNGGVLPCDAPPLLWRADPTYRLSPKERAWLWDPYLRRVADAVSALRRVDPGYGNALPALRPRDRAREAWQRASLRGYEAALGLARSRAA
jgi:hypothetical protein